MSINIEQFREECMVAIKEFQKDVSHEEGFGFMKGILKSIDILKKLEKESKSLEVDKYLYSLEQEEDDRAIGTVEKLLQSRDTVLHS